MKQTLFYRIKTINLPQVNLTDTVVIKPPYIHFRRKASEYILYYVLSGEMHLMEGNELYILRQNDIIILDPSHEHYGVKSSTCNFIYLHFNLENMDEITSSTEELKNLILQRRTQTMNSQKSLSEGLDSDQNDIIIPKCYHINDTSMAIELISQLDKLQGIHKTMLEYRQIQTGCLLIELLLTLSREYISEFLVQKNTATSKSLRTVYDIIAFLDSSYSTDITGDLLEEKFNCNFDYINRVFKETLGKTIFTYLNRLRIEKAKQFLSTQIYSLTDVAEKTGFHDVYYFSKVFKKYAGITPGAYMNQLT
jgi:YesN/AraC family two-component response regulator